MANSRKLKVNIFLGLEGKGADEAVKDVQRLGKNIQSLTGTAIKASAAFVAFRGAAALGDFAKRSITEAQSLERGLAALGTIFGDQADEMLEFSRGASEIGLSMTEAAKASTFLGSVLKQSGFAMEETAELTQRLVRLANDLAITYQYDVQEALLAMTALFRGEYDPIEKFGVAMKQNEIEGVKLERGLEKLTGRAEIFADQQIRLELLFQRATDAEGAYARQSETLFVRQQQLAAAFRNVQSTVGLALTPSLEKLTFAMIPVVESLTPVLVELFGRLALVVETLTANKDRLVGVVFGLFEIFSGLAEVIFRATENIVTHIDTYKNLAIAFGAVVVGTRLFGILVTVIAGATSVLKTFNITLGFTAVALRRLKIAIASTGFGLIAIGIGEVAARLMEATDAATEFPEELAAVEQIDLEALMDEMAGATSVAQNLGDGFEEAAGGAAAAKDAVGDFYRTLSDESAKQRAKLELQELGASEGLINSVLGSGEDWFRVFQSVTARGAESIREVQALFATTPAGIDAAMQEFEEQMRVFEQFRDAALEAKDGLIDFVNGFQILSSVEQELGRFERAAVTQLEGIEEKLEDAFDNGYILEQSLRQLQEYARKEFSVLREIERQRDELIARRDAAQRLIESVSDSVVAGGRLVQVLQDVQRETQQVDMVKVVKDTIQEANGLREFEVILTSAVVEPIEEVKSKSAELVAGYRGIVDRTRKFVRDMKALRELGLDPQLFNELVEAGVEAGGETAQALLEGGSSTVSEINSLFDELNSLGEELGNETAEVMYGQGENFVDGIVQGLDAQAASLEAQATLVAENFTQTFEDVLSEGINLAIEQAQPEPIEIPINFGAVPALPAGAGGGGAGGAEAAVSAAVTGPDLTQLVREAQEVRAALEAAEFGPQQFDIEPPTFAGKFKAQFDRVLANMTVFGAEFTRFFDILFPGAREQITTGFANLREGFNNFFLNTLPQLLFEGSVAFNEGFEKFNEAFTRFNGWLDENLTPIREKFNTTFYEVVDILGMSGDEIRQKLAETWETTLADLNTWMEELGIDFDSLSEKFFGWATNIFTNFYDGVLEKFAEIQLWFEETFSNEDSTIKSFFEDLPDELLQIGKDMFDGLWDGLISKWNEIERWAGDTFNGFKNLIKDVFDIDSPSKVMKGYGEDIGQGFLDGLQTMTPRVNVAMGEMAMVPSAGGARAGGTGPIVINASSRADGASIAKTVSNYSFRNTARNSDSWNRRSLRVS